MLHNTFHPVVGGRDLHVEYVYDPRHNAYDSMTILDADTGSDAEDELGSGELEDVRDACDFHRYTLGSRRLQDTKRCLGCDSASDQSATERKAVRSAVGHMADELVDCGLPEDRAVERARNIAQALQFPEFLEKGETPESIVHGMLRRYASVVHADTVRRVAECWKRAA
jgi:hypothetical protein